VKPMPRYSAPSRTGFLPTGVVGLGNSPVGSSAGVVLRSRVCGSEAQALIFETVVGSFKGQLTTRPGKMGAAQVVDHRRWVIGA
jgi:hypothetical protein